MEFFFVRLLLIGFVVKEFVFLFLFFSVFVWMFEIGIEFVKFFIELLWGILLLCFLFVFLVFFCDFLLFLDVKFFFKDCGLNVDFEVKWGVVFGVFRLFFLVIWFVFWGLLEFLCFIVKVCNELGVFKGCEVLEDVVVVVIFVLFVIDLVNDGLFIFCFGLVIEFWLLVEEFVNCLCKI